MRTLVTGGAGVVGSYVVRDLVAQGERPVAVDVAPGDRVAREHGDRVMYHQLDITELESLTALCRRHEITSVIHLAALTGSAPNDEPMVMFRANMLGTMHVLEAARLTGVRRVVMASTRTVYPDFDGTRYGHPTYEPVPEDHWLSPRRPYEVWKHAAERMGEFYREKFGMEFAGFRLGIYLAGEHALRPAGRAMGTLHAMIGNAVRGRPTTLPAGGERRMDVVYVRDLAQAFIRAARAPSLEHSVYNVGRGSAVTPREFASALRAAVPAAEIAIGAGIDFAPGHYCVLDITRARRDFGYEPTWSLEATVADSVRRAREVAQERTPGSDGRA